MSLWLIHAAPLILRIIRIANGTVVATPADMSVMPTVFRRLRLILLESKSPMPTAPTARVAMISQSSGS